MQIGILNLPETTNALNSDSFIINTSSNEGITQRILFSSIQLGLENTTLTPTITSHSQDITEIYTNIYSLSTQSAYLNSYLNNLINSTVTNAFASLTDVLFPLSSIKCTANNINPGYYIHLEVIKGFLSDEVGEKYQVIEVNSDDKKIIVKGDDFLLSELETAKLGGTIYWSQAKDDVGPKDIFKFFKGTPEERAN